MEDRDYYLTVSDNNMRIISNTGENIVTQMNMSDDSPRVQHVIYKQGSYAHRIMLHTLNGGLSLVSSDPGAGNGRANVGEILRISSGYNISITNDYDIYTANKFIKFDGDCFEPVYYEDNSRYTWETSMGTAKFRIWYVTKKDGSNWTSQTEMNNANIEDMDIYDNIEDIPEDRYCIGLYIETTEGYIKEVQEIITIYMYL